VVKVFDELIEKFRLEAFKEKIKSALDGCTERIRNKEPC